MVSAQSLTLWMDYGQFYIHGGVGDDEDAFDLVELAMANHPAASDGKTVVVLCPHQNNFEMPVRVEVWTARPDDDRDEWQQVSESQLQVGPNASLYYDSPTGAGSDPIPVPDGEYVIEVSGRGFVNYGWPGTTTPGDEWRFRLWPADGSALRPPVQWNMPGYGVPENVPISEKNDATSEPEEPQSITVFGGSGQPSRTVHVDELRAEAEAAEREAWGGDPISELDRFFHGKDITRLDRALAESIAAMSETDLRRLARWCVGTVYAYAGLTERPWVAPALAALASGEDLPEPFHDPVAAHARLSEDDYPDGAGVTVEASIVHRTHDITYNPFDRGRPVHRPSFAINAIFSAQHPDALDAAMGALVDAAATYSADARDLFAAIRAEFGIPDA